MLRRSSSISNTAQHMEKEAMKTIEQEVIETEKRRLRKSVHNSFQEEMLKKGKRQRKYKAVSGQASKDDKHSDDDCCEKCVIF